MRVDFSKRNFDYQQKSSTFIFSEIHYFPTLIIYQKWRSNPSGSSEFNQFYELY